MNSLEIISGIPNGSGDEKPEDDTLHLDLYIPSDVDTLPFCTDFESGQDLYGYDPINNTTDTVWTYGSPQKTLINAPFSGSNCWFISPRDTYGALYDQYLYTPALPISKGQCYRLEFTHFFDTERFYDGGTVEYSTDGGSNWDVFGLFYNVPGWYNTEYILALDLLNPGWSGSSGGWKSAQYSMKFDNDTSVQFRFRFASDNDIHYEGWAIDDLCFTQLDSNCKTVDIEELSLNARLKIYPNPARDHLNIVLPHPDLHSVYTMEIIDQRGMPVNRSTFKVTDNETVKTVDVSKLSSGIYVIRIRSEKGVFREYFMK